ncbi:TPA: hypothetical protein ACS8CD_001820 [Providencia alcalifaciens]|uniref:hypothetical protein n=1 Tax=Providencia rustigianii TaxID=158850 RepID=UPI0022437E14|nr:hypothetical protein [Providencia rustigianii]
MSDKKEVTELSIKVSVDTTELDKLEAQLKRIAGLLVDAGLKNKVEFKIDIASGDYTKDAGELVGFTAEYFECSHNSKLIVGHVICDAALQSADVIHKIKQELDEAARVQEAERKAVGEKIRQLSIDALRNSSGFA